MCCLRLHIRCSLVEGVSLAKLLKTGPMHQQLAIKIAIQLAEIGLPATLFLLSLFV